MPTVIVVPIVPSLMVRVPVLVPVVIVMVAAVVLPIDWAVFDTPDTPETVNVCATQLVPLPAKLTTIPVLLTGTAVGTAAIVAATTIVVVAVMLLSGSVMVSVPGVEPYH